MQRISGIYKIINKINGKYYVGSSDHIYRRWRDHKKHLRKNSHYNTHLQNAWNKYGEEQFEFLIAEQCPENFLLTREQFYLNECKTITPIVYNTIFVAGGGNINGGKICIFKNGFRKIIDPESFETFSRAGWIRGSGPMDEETKRKIGNANRGKKKPPFSIEHRYKLGQTSKRRTYVMTPEHREKLRLSRIGKRHTAETRKKMSINKRGNNHPMYGKHHSETTKLKLHEAMDGKFNGVKNPRFDTQKYTFVNETCGKEISCTRYDLYRQYNLNPSNVNKLLKGRIKTIGGWSLKTSTCF